MVSTQQFHIIVVAVVAISCAGLSYETEKNAALELTDSDKIEFEKKYAYALLQVVN